jgi:hypothetical protein
VRACPANGAGQARLAPALIPAGLQVDDARQKTLLDAVRVDPRIGTDADMLETPFEDLRTAVLDWLARDAALPPQAAAATERAPGVASSPTSGTPSGSAVERRAVWRAPGNHPPHFEG